MEKLNSKIADQSLKDSIDNLNDSIELLSKIAICGVEKSFKYEYRLDLISDKLNELIKIRNALREILG